MKVVDSEKYFEQIDYVPHPKQWLFHRSPARFRAPVCGRRFGKSTMAARDEEPRLLIPDRRVWIVGPTYDLAEKEFRVLWDDMMIRLELGKNKQVKRANNKRAGEMFIEFPWKTRIECRSADHPENLVGERLDHVIMSEAAKHKKDTWERFIRPALADRRGTATFPTTPEGYNWLYNIWALGQNPGFPDYESWQFPSWDNPAVYPGGRNDPEILNIESTSLTPWFLQEIAASFSAFVGQIYSEFQETVHVKKLEYNPAWPNYIAFDWGFVNPMAAIEFQVAPDDTIYIWREHYKAYMRLEEHLDLLKNRAQPPGYKVDLCFGDAADPEAILTVNQKFGPCIGDPLAKSNWRQGVELVKRFLKRRPVSNTMDLTELIDKKDVASLGQYGLEGPPGLFVDYSCTNTIREFNNYRAPQMRQDRNPREDAQKYDDHALDAIRYGLVHLYELGASSHLAEVYAPSDFSESPEAGYFTMDSMEM